MILPIWLVNLLIAPVNLLIGLSTCSLACQPAHWHVNLLIAPVILLIWLVNPPIAPVNLLIVPVNLLNGRSTSPLLLSKSAMSWTCIGHCIEMNCKYNGHELEMAWT